MKQALALLAAVLIVTGSAWAQAPAAGGNPTSKALESLAARTKNSLAVVRFNIQDQVIGSASITGMAICVGKGAGNAGVLITTALDPRVQPETIKDVEVTIPDSQKKLAAKYRSTDPATGITFVDVTDAYEWTPVEFAKKADLRIGRQVLSVGLLDAALGNKTYYGVAYVSAKVRVPGPMVYVTGGWLTNIGSPVFTADGVAVGMVQQQLPTPAGISSSGGPANILIRGQRETSYFMPVDDFVHVITSPPQRGKRLPWIGVLRFKPYPENIVPLGVPAVTAETVVPGSPAAKVGLKDNSTITGLNGHALEEMPTPQLTVSNFVRQLNRIQIGSKITLTVLEGAKPKVLEMVVDAFPKTPQEAAKYFSRPLGLYVREKVELDKVLDTTPTAEVPGVYVVGVVNGGPSAKSGVKTQPPDLVVSVAGQPVNTVAGFQALCEQALNKDPRKPVNVMVRRGDVNQSISIQPE
ncbi:MAG TPA: PDZ domain-containing protein [Phycisphaerae bacterium]|nr:PDZ domain-containing protein [Phycisphaerae bacterium]